MSVKSYLLEKKNPFYFKGENPTVDLVVFRDTKESREILLIRRAKNAATEQGKWAIPGGFHDTDAKKGGEWRAGKETTLAAALRELKEETGLDVNKYKKSIVYVGTYKGKNRDPRDNDESWTSSSVFTILLKKEDNQKIKGLDDADKAAWVKLKDLKKLTLAFDHKEIIKDAGNVVRH